MKSILIAILSFFGLAASSPEVPVPTPTPSLAYSNSAPSLVLPVEQLRSRITKKSFGTYVNPANSPVSPEKFTGFHTGVDVEFNDDQSEVTVNSIGHGKIIYSGVAQGYGGVVAQQINFQNQDYVVVYGHLKPSSMVKVGEELLPGQQLGVLGDGYSPETDNERKHLHLSILKGNNLVLLGYVQTESELTKWVDPLLILP